MNIKERVQKNLEHMMAMRAAKQIMPMDLGPRDEPLPAKYVYHNAHTKDTKYIEVWAKMDENTELRSLYLYTDQSLEHVIDPASLYHKMDDGAEIILCFCAEPEEGMSTICHSKYRNIFYMRATNPDPTDSAEHGTVMECFTFQDNGFNDDTNIVVTKVTYLDGSVEYTAGFMGS